MFEGLRRMRMSLFIVEEGYLDPLRWSSRRSWSRTGCVTETRLRRFFLYVCVMCTHCVLRLQILAGGLLNELASIPTSAFSSSYVCLKNSAKTSTRYTCI